MKSFYVGIDIGSTTAKIVLLDSDFQEIFSDYRRHNTEIKQTLLDLLQETSKITGNCSLSIQLTGTAAMGIAERTSIAFEQEVVASAEVVRVLYPDVSTLIDLGGEDAKIIFFRPGASPDIRMNGNCAGGTGAFIDQMATLLNVPVEQLNQLASESTKSYSIASRCGVFAKTDIQNLISRHISKADIAASIYRAVAYQTMNSLARGFDILPKVIFAGGPLSFQPVLRETFKEIMGLKDSDIQEVPDAKMLPALGAALSSSDTGTQLTMDEFISRVSSSEMESSDLSGRLEPLFSDEEEYKSWEEEKALAKCAFMSLSDLSEGEPLFLGIDSGSTTTKIVVSNQSGQIAGRYYHTNDGDPVGTVFRGLESIRADFKAAGKPFVVRYSAVTGYGEDLIRFAFSLDEGLVETIAHFRAARFFSPDVSFVLDIGGQDMKAIFIEDGIIRNLELNEACSSGCGSFLQAFSQSLGRKVEDFAKEGVLAASPCDLGTRCTVFMNSKVKQSLREGATIGDISAGLAYSVIKNCFNKVLKMTDYSVLGERIVVQGGTFKNHAVLRAVEKVTGRKVVSPDISELMGAYGSALTAADSWLSIQNKKESSFFGTFIGMDQLESVLDLEQKSFQCSGCENFCSITRLKRTGNDAVFFSGNKCEKVFSNKLHANRKGINLHEEKKRLIFDRVTSPNRKLLNILGTTKPLGRIGIPRVLNMWEDYPFWSTFLTQCGYEVVVSDFSTGELAEKGYSTVVSENLCFPAKIVNGHIYNLIEKNVDRIFYPMVRFNKDDQQDALNSFNCPVVTGYPEVVGSAINPEKKFNIPLDQFPVSFKSEKLLKEVCFDYISSLGYPVRGVLLERAFKKAIHEQNRMRIKLKESALEIIENAEKENRTVILLAGRPYHVDSLINHKIPEMISSLGIDIITEDSIPDDEITSLDDVQVLTQWSFPNRIYEAAAWAGERANIEFIQLNSFGCGPDAIVVDEVKGILNSFGKNPTVVRIDEMTSPGSVKLRMRSMIESMNNRSAVSEQPQQSDRVDTRPFLESDKKKKILAPLFSPFYTDFLIATFANSGYDLEILPMPDKQSTEIGLKYANNDICYPATIVIGDIIKALQSGKYDIENTAVAITQTGGQCRASSYVSLLKKAMVNAGFENIPVVTVSTDAKGVKPLNYQPGFYAGSTEMMLNSLFGLMLGDVLAKLYYSTAVREKNAGESQALVDSFIFRGKTILDYKKSRKIFSLMREAVDAFNQVEVVKGDLPKVGIVGEIYVKFNPYGNGFVTDWLMSREIEPDVPPLIGFFLQKFITDEFNSGNKIEKKSRAYLRTLRVVELMVDGYLRRTNRILSRFKRKVSPIHPIRGVAKDASTILSLINQFGESWLLAGDIAGFIKDDVNDVVCLQPFGCIANHVIAKGVEKRLKEMYPQLNLLFLDMDSGASEVNTTNRLEFLVKVAKEKYYQEQKSPLDWITAKAGSAADVVKTKAGSAVGKVKSTAGSAAGKVKSTAGNAAEKVKSTASMAVDKVNTTTGKPASKVN